MKNKIKVCFIASSGGHLEEIKQLKAVINKYNHYFIVAKSKATINSSEFRYHVLDINKNNCFKKIISSIITTLQQLIIFFKEKPDYIITTGPGMVIPTCLIGKIMKKKLIFIESFARINTPSRTGKILYKHSDLFLIQNEELKKFYPKAIYGGGVF